MRERLLTSLLFGFLLLAGLISCVPVTPVPTPLPTPSQVPTKTPLPAEITDPEGVVMRLVPAGEFQMGSADSDPISDWPIGWEFYALPSQLLELEAFYIDKYEVTNAHYGPCVDAGFCNPPKQTSSYSRPNYFGNPLYGDFPVIYVDWQMANGFCRWRGARLPTEAEWEKAARGTDARLYPWGESISCENANFWGCVGDTASAGSYESGTSPYGVYELFGNVQEWVSSLAVPYPYDSEDGREDLTTPGKRVLRGKACNSTLVWRLGVDSRLNNDPITNNNTTGFRCARNP